MTPTLETKRLILRPVRIEDAETAQPLFNNWDVVKWLDGDNVPWPYPADGCRTFYKDILLPKVATGATDAWAIIEKDSNNFTGLLELTTTIGKDNRGFWLGLPYHGKGYMTEVVTVTTDYAFDTLKMDYLMLGNAAENIASSRIKRNAHAQLVKTENGKFVCGPRPKEIWKLTPEAWRNSPMKQKYG
jgi:[ribosomal protein S5]-alanine N-acetyltransferase